MAIDYFDVPGGEVVRSTRCDLILETRKRRVPDECARRHMSGRDDNQVLKLGRARDANRQATP